MITSEYTICAERVIRDAETNSISAIGVLEEINAEAFPVIVPQVGLLFVLIRDQADPNEIETQVSVRIGENVLFNAPFQVRFQGARRTRAIIVLQGLVIPNPGRVAFRLRWNEHTLGEWHTDANVLGGAQLRLPLPNTATASSATASREPASSRRGA